MIIMKIDRKKWAWLFVLLLGMHAARAQQVSYVQLATTNGVLEGVVSADGKVRTFKGIPYAAPPVGPLRWKAPQPAPSWKRVRKAADYGARAMQGRIYNDMVFHDPGPSEDCLYLNLWMPASPPPSKLPVMVWIHGGGFVAGSSSEPRQDAGNLSKKGVMVVSFNYRMGVFGFFAHPELAKESGHNASGNYGLLDQVAALQWIKTNIATFGGDPDNVTIFGESAGSFSVSALMASPLARGLFRRAIGESGAFFGNTLALKSRVQAEEAGVKFAEAAFGTTSLEALRAKPAQALLDAALKQPQSYFPPDIDGYFLPADCLSIYAAGQQSHVPLLAGWNRDEAGYQSYFTNDAPSPGELCQARHGAIRRQCARLSGSIRGDKRCPGKAGGAGLRRRPLHSLRHLEMARNAAQDRRVSGVPLRVRSDPAVAGECAARHGGGGAACLRDRVRLPRAHLQAVAVAAGGPRCVGTHGFILVQLRQDGRSERPGPAAVAGV